MTGIRETTFQQREQVTIDFLDVCAEDNFSPEQIRGCRRNASIVAQRVVIAKLLRDYGWSYPLIGHAMNRDHTSIMHLVRKE